VRLESLDKLNTNANSVIWIRSRYKYSTIWFIKSMKIEFKNPIPTAKEKHCVYIKRAPSLEYASELYRPSEYC
jgi:hypothetical protein